MSQCFQCGRRIDVTTSSNLCFRCEQTKRAMPAQSYSEVYVAELRARLAAAEKSRDEWLAAAHQQEERAGKAERERDEARLVNQSEGMLCPHCKRDIGNMTVLYGRCSECGEMLVSEEEKANLAIYQPELRARCEKRGLIGTPSTSNEPVARDDYDAVCRGWEEARQELAATRNRLAEAEGERDKYSAQMMENHLLWVAAKNRLDEARGLLIAAKTAYDNKSPGFERAFRELCAFLANRPAEPAEQSCVWTFDYDGGYKTGCGQRFMFTDYGPKENGANYCQYCGKKLVVPSEPTAEAQ